MRPVSSPTHSNTNANVEGRQRALDVVRQELREAVAARKCHACGCLRATVEALQGTDAGRGELAGSLAEAHAVLIPKTYDCLGCEVCYPAIAANAFAEAFPREGESLDLCPTESPEARSGWPPLPGDYQVVRYRAPVAVCTLNSDALAARLAESAVEGLAIAGTLHTENLGIERLIRNVLANPHVRGLLVCGEDTRHVIGHLPGQSLASLFQNGLDEAGRIRGARGKRPVLQNVTRAQVEAFREQVTLVSRIGETDLEVLSAQVAREAGDAPGPFEGSPVDVGVPALEVAEPKKLVPDPAGYCVIYPDRARARLLLEHYTNAGVLDCVLDGPTPAAVYGAAVERGLVSRLDHAAYLGGELARAERSLQTGERYVQDRAAGHAIVEESTKCGCGASSGPADKP